MCLFDSCEDMAKTKTGAIIVLQRSNSLDFTLTENNRSSIKLMPQILESIFFKNSPLHDGAIIIEKNNIIATESYCRFQTVLKCLLIMVFVTELLKVFQKKQMLLFW